ncbi:hypothetical protein LSAT2_017171 [Lamellibrachia satsuma]|nr:hypothetical protein LSAT2_017171 [Lamellibrachia satsuma]
MTTQDDKLQSGRHSQSPWVDLRDLFPAEEPLLASQEDTGSDEPQPISPPPVSPIDRAGDNEGKTSPTGFSPRQETHSPYRGVPSTRPQREANVRPFLRFRRAAKAISIIVKVCNICKSVALESVVNEEWYALIDSFTETPEGNTEHMKKRGRPFVTFVPNENKQLEELAFDKSAYSREFRADYLITDDIRTTLRVKAPVKTPEQINEVKTVLPNTDTSSFFTKLHLQPSCVF